VHLPAERIVATGDLVVSPVPFGFFSHLGSWPTTLRTLESLGATQIVPGHGELMTDWTYVHSLIRLMESMWNQVSASVRAGRDLAATQQAMNIDSLRALFPGVSAPALNAMFLTPGTQSAFADLTADSLAIFGEEGKVLDVVYGFFAAMARKDTATVRTFFEPNARLVGIRADTAGNERLQVFTWEQFSQRIASDSRPQWNERAFRPQVRIRGTLADVWTEYDFHFGGTPSHCGVDSIQLLKI
jgi:hypothetical protein